MLCACTGRVALHCHSRYDWKRRKEESSCSQISDLCSKFSERRDLEGFDPLRYPYQSIATDDPGLSDRVDIKRTEDRRIEGAWYGRFDMRGHFMSRCYFAFGSKNSTYRFVSRITVHIGQRYLYLKIAIQWWLPPAPSCRYLMIFPQAVAIDVTSGCY